MRQKQTTKPRSDKTVIIVIAVVCAILLLAGATILTVILLKRDNQKTGGTPEAHLTEEPVGLESEWLPTVPARDLLVSLQVAETSWNRVRVYEYNQSGLIVQDGEYAYHYNANGFLTKKTLTEPRPDNPDFEGVEAQEREYDARGRLSRFGRYGSQDVWFVSEYTYDEENRIVTETMMRYSDPADKTVDQEETYTHSYSTEADGTVIDTQTSDTGKQYRTVMKDGKVLSQREKEWQRDASYEYLYESPQYMVRAEQFYSDDQSGKTVRLLMLDSVGAVIDSIRLGADVQLEYDDAGRLISIKDETGEMILALSYNDKDMIGGEPGSTDAAAETGNQSQQIRFLSPVAVQTDFCSVTVTDAAYETNDLGAFIRLNLRLENKLAETFGQASDRQKTALCYMLDASIEGEEREEYPDRYYLKPGKTTNCSIWLYRSKADLAASGAPGTISLFLTVRSAYDSMPFDDKENLYNVDQTLTFDLFDAQKTEAVATKPFVADRILYEDDRAAMVYLGQYFHKSLVEESSIGIQYLIINKTDAALSWSVGSVFVNHALAQNTVNSNRRFNDAMAGSGAKQDIEIYMFDMRFLENPDAVPDGADGNPDITIDSMGLTLCLRDAAGAEETHMIEETELPADS